MKSIVIFTEIKFKSFDDKGEFLSPTDRPQEVKLRVVHVFYIENGRSFKILKFFLVTWLHSYFVVTKHDHFGCFYIFAVFKNECYRSYFKTHVWFTFSFVFAHRQFAEAYLLSVLIGYRFLNPSLVFILSEILFSALTLGEMVYDSLSRSSTNDQFRNSDSFSRI